MIYKSRITEIGPAALGMLENNMLILFNDDAPSELRDISVLHEKAEMAGEIKEGQTVTVSGETFVVEGVGERVNESFLTLGHCCLVFNAGNRPALPCQIMLSGEVLPQVSEGDFIEVSE